MISSLKQKSLFVKTNFLKFSDLSKGKITLNIPFSARSLYAETMS